MTEQPKPEDRWYYSTNEERWTGFFGSRDEAVVEGKCDDHGGVIWVARGKTPPMPWELLRVDGVVDQVMESEEYDHDLAEWLLNATDEQLVELEAALKTAMQAWCEHHGKLPTWTDIDPDTVEQVELEDDAHA